MTEDEPSEGTGCGGVVVATVAATLPLLALYAISRDALVLAVWVVGWGAVIWTAKHVPRAANHSPPPLPERGCEEEPQVSILRDKSHPNRWTVARPSRWMTEEIDKEAGTS